MLHTIKESLFFLENWVFGLIYRLGPWRPFSKLNTLKAVENTFLIIDQIKELNGGLF